MTEVTQVTLNFYIYFIKNKRMAKNEEHTKNDQKQFGK
jgi:hypothetical protein